MSFLADTCALLHAAQAPERLSPAARTALSGVNGAVFISAVSIAELACLVQKKRIHLPEHWADWFRATVDALQWTVLAVGEIEFREAYLLVAPIHNDPCDRIIIATARVHDLALITTDGLILDYPYVRSMS